MLAPDLRWEFRTARSRDRDARSFVRRCTSWMRGSLEAGRMDGVGRGARPNDRGPGVAQLSGRCRILSPSVIGRCTCRTFTFSRPRAVGRARVCSRRRSIGPRERHRSRRVVAAKRSVTLYRRHGFLRGAEVMELRSDEIHGRALHVVVDSGLRGRVLWAVEGVIAVFDDVDRRRGCRWRRSALAGRACRTHRDIPWTNSMGRPMGGRCLLWRWAGLPGWMQRIAEYNDQSRKRRSR